MTKSATTLDDVISAVGEMFTQQSESFMTELGNMHESLDLEIAKVRGLINEVHERLDRHELKMSRLELNMIETNQKIDMVRAFESDIREIYEMLESLQNRRARPKELQKVADRVSQAEKEIAYLRTRIA